MITIWKVTDWECSAAVMKNHRKNRITNLRRIFGNVASPLSKFSMNWSKITIFALTK